MKSNNRFTLRPAVKISPTCTKHLRDLTAQTSGGLAPFPLALGSRG